ncbi:hypothetical protein [Clostridium sp. CF012]|nr:hypothetical protein [Clostridium sp. CF012]
MLVYNNIGYTFKKHLKTSNIGLGKFTLVKVNMKLNYNLIKNT